MNIIFDIKCKTAGKELLNDTPQYFPKRDLEFIKENITESVKSYCKNTVTTSRIFDECIDKYVNWRRIHAGVIMIYIMSQAKKQKSISSVNNSASGTQGSPLELFIKDTIDSTKQAKIDKTKQVKIIKKVSCCKLIYNTLTNIRIYLYKKLT